jgi:hypothetical protein
VQEVGFQLLLRDRRGALAGELHQHAQRTGVCLLGAFALAVELQRGSSGASGGSGPVDLRFAELW